jgi:hypothetical protein
MYKPGTVGSYTNVTTETILQRLGLSEQGRFEEGFMSDHKDTERTTSLETAKSPDPEPSTSAFEMGDNRSHVDLIRPSANLSKRTYSPSHTDHYRSNHAVESESLSFSTESSWDPAATGSSANITEASMPSLTCLQKSPLVYSPGPVNIDSSVRDNFDLFFAPVVESIPAEPLTAIEDEFGFDPPTWLSAPGAPNRILPTSVCANVESYIAPRDLQSFCASPPPLTTTATESASSLDTARSPVSEPQDVVQLELPTARSTARNLPSARRRPGRPRNALRADQGNPASEADKRDILLEKNRVAASKCREKKKAEISALKDASAASREENSLLRRQTTELREEVLHLREELFAHVVCVEYCEQEKWRAALGATGRGTTLVS